MSRRSAMVKSGAPRVLDWPPVSKRQAPPGPRFAYPGQAVVDLVRDPIGLLERVATYGDVAQIKIGPQRIVAVNHPDEIRKVLVTEQRAYTKGRGLQRSKRLLGEGLLTSEGDAHLRQRRLVQPAFHRERIAEYGRAMVDYARETSAAWCGEEAIDVYQHMMRLTLRIAGRTLFSTEMSASSDDVTGAIAHALGVFRYAILPFGQLLEYLPLPSMRRLRQARARIDTILYSMIAERRKSGVDRGDLLSMLLAARDTEGDGSGLTDQQVRDEVITLLAAGHETTAVALTWTWYLLSQHPNVERTLHQELDLVLGGRPPTVADLDRLVYTRRVLTEAMRLYPPAWVIERRAARDVTLGEYNIPAGSLVIVSPYLAQRDRRWYREPLSFDPDRWALGAEAERPKFAYFPFGAGTRVCIGESFAWMEGTLLLATIAQAWRLLHEPGHIVDWEPLITLRPRHGMRMVLQPRQSSVRALGVR